MSIGTPEYRENVGFVVTCEHASNHVPAEFEPLFTEAGDALNSHRGWDPGAVILARQLAQQLGVEALTFGVSRLLVEGNRSLHHRQLWSKYSQALSAQEKQAILDRWYRPFRAKVRSAIETLVGKGCTVVHYSVHSFTPVLNGEQRNADLGLLYDPGRSAERSWCNRLRDHITETSPGLRVRRNYPYRGSADGHTTALRRQFGDDRYLGIELEWNQGLFDEDAQCRTDNVLAAIRCVAAFRGG